MSNEKNSKYISFFFRNWNNSNKNLLPLMKKSKTNKDMNFINNQEEMNRRIIKKVNYNYIFKEFNLNCKKANNKISQKYLINLSDELFSNSRNHFHTRKNDYRTHINFHKKSKNNSLFTLKENLNQKNFNNDYEEERVYDFRQKFSRVKDTITQLKNKYQFYNLPKFIKDEISSNKIKKIFNNDFSVDFNNEYQTKKRKIMKIKNHSFSEKLCAMNNGIKIKEKKIHKKNKDEIKIDHSNDANEIENYINNNLKKIEYFKSISSSQFKVKLENHMKRRKSNIFLNYMKLKKKGEQLKLIINDK